MSERKEIGSTPAEKVSMIGCSGMLVGGFLLIIGVIGAVATSSASIVPIYILIIAAVLLLIGFILFFMSPGLQDEEEKKRSKEMQEAYLNREKYNSLKYTCPMCGSHKIMNIGTAKKVGGVVAVGLASKNIGKNYQCDDCGYRW